MMEESVFLYGAPRWHQRQTIIRRQMKWSKTWRAFPRHLGYEDDLACGAGLHDFDVGACCFGERKLFAHHRTQRAVFETGDDAGVNLRGFDVRDSPKSDSEKGGAANHEFAGVDCDFSTIADDDHAALCGEELQVVREIYVGQHFENYVQAACRSGLQNFILIAGFGVIKDLVGALSFGDFQTFLRAGGAKDGESDGAGHLRGGDAHASACAVDQYRFSSANFRSLIQGVIRGAVGNPDASALSKSYFVGKTMHLILERDGVLRVGAADGAGGVDAVARFHFLDVWAYRFDDTSGVGTRRVG